MRSGSRKKNVERNLVCNGSSSSSLAGIRFSDGVIYATAVPPVQYVTITVTLRFNLDYFLFVCFETFYCLADRPTFIRISRLIEPFLHLRINWYKFATAYNRYCKKNEWIFYRIKFCILKVGLEHIKNKKIYKQTKPSFKN